MHFLSLREMAEKVSAFQLSQLDLLTEGKNLSKFAENFEESKTKEEGRRGSIGKLERVWKAH
jgi:predicted unusual protein kinase regulating ubiquinone biosynthesis (AarF/ABC1/UbiB family)